MRIFLLAILLIAHNAIAARSTIEERVSKVSSLISQYPDSAFSLALQLKTDSENENHMYGLVQSNYILAYIMDDVNGDYGKAIIYYLEAIRYAKKFSYEKKFNNLISLHKNCGVIFRKFKAYQLAIEYYEKGLEYAFKTNSESQITSISYNLSSVYLDMKNFEEAIRILEGLSNNLQSNHKKYLDVNNRLALIYLQAGYKDESFTLANKIKTTQGNNKKLIDTYQILGRIHSLDKRYATADTCFNLALEIANSNNLQGSQKKSYFETYRDLGNNQFAQGKYKNAEKLYKKAEVLISELVQKPSYFELYKAQANVHYNLKNYSESKHYEDLYSSSFNEYISVQEEIRETDQRYNMELITKRYFAEVDKQERIASILLYSKLTSGGLLALLFIVIAYHRFQKVRLRKSIERELIALKIIE